MRTLTVVTTMWLCTVPPAYADGGVPPALSTRLDALVPGVAPDHVVETGMAGMYEVRFGSVIVYLSGDGRHMLRGDLIDLAARRNLTEETRRSMRAETVGALGEASMIVFAPDRVKHTVTVFTDVDCAYCARLHRQMADYNQLGIEVRYTAFPRAGIGSPTHGKMVSVWCAADQHTAMTDAKAGRPVETVRCDHPVSDHYEAGRTIGVTGTPAILLESGELIPGYVPPQELASRLDGDGSG